MNACQSLTGMDVVAAIAAVFAGLNTILITWSHISASAGRAEVRTALNGSLHPTAPPTGGTAA